LVGDIILGIIRLIDPFFMQLIISYKNEIFGIVLDQRDEGIES
jgi:hypothetical protein